MPRQRCKDCHRREKMRGRHRCLTCQLRIEPIDKQVEAAERRLAMVPEAMRTKRTKAIVALSPAGTTWCAGCQSFRDLVDFAAGATQCRPCASGKAHATRIEKTYGIDAAGYKKLLALQGGKCAICRSRPKSKRLAVDHDHQTGVVRGLLCAGKDGSGCNYALGRFHDDAEILWRAQVYMSTPPATQSGITWDEHLSRNPRPALGSAESPAAEVDPLLGVVTRPSGKAGAPPIVAAAGAECTRLHVIPVGSERVPGKRGVWRYFVEADGDAPF